jgi:hypothetical protein
VGETVGDGLDGSLVVMGVIVISGHPLKIYIAVIHFIICITLEGDFFGSAPTKNVRDQRRS